MSVHLNTSKVVLLHATNQAKIAISDSLLSFSNHTTLTNPQAQHVGSPKRMPLPPSLSLVCTIPTIYQRYKTNQEPHIQQIILQFNKPIINQDQDILPEQPSTSPISPILSNVNQTTNPRTQFTTTTHTNIKNNRNTRPQYANEPSFRRSTHPKRTGYHRWRCRHRSWLQNQSNRC